jgi:5-methylcytosine-specific restriction protein A
MPVKMLRTRVAQGKPATRMVSTSTERTRGHAWMRTRERILRRDNGLCCECRRGGKLKLACEVDHITPLRRGGTDDEANLQSLCVSCHEAKSLRERAADGGRG